MLELHQPFEELRLPKLAGFFFLGLLLALRRRLHAVSGFGTTFFFLVSLVFLSLQQLDFAGALLHLLRQDFDLLRIVPPFSSSTYTLVAYG